MYHIEFSRVIKAPFDKTFAWCTDYQPEDVRFYDEPQARRILSREKNKVVLEGVYKDGHKYTATVKLMPPNRWEADVDGDDVKGHVVYTLENVADGTKFTCASDVSYRGKRKNKTLAEAQRDSEAFWDRVIPVLEKEVST